MRKETGLSSVFTTSAVELRCWDLAFEVQAQPSKSFVPMKNSQALSALCMDPWALANQITDTEQPLCLCKWVGLCSQKEGRNHLCH